MKKAFTMIELIFVIVILGILAAVAIPKLNATRDDAEITKAITNFSTAINDIVSYYTSKGKFATNIQDMTNVPLEPHTSNKSSAHIKIGNFNCLTINANVSGSVIKIFAAPGYKSGLCVKFFETNAVSQTMGGADINDYLSVNKAYTIQLGTGNVNF